MEKLCPKYRKQLPFPLCELFLFLYGHSYSYNIQ